MGLYRNLNITKVNRKKHFVFIYGIKDKAANSIIYVGSAIEPIERFYRHTGRQGNYYNMDVVIYLFEMTQREERYSRECYWLTKMVERGEPVRNIRMPKDRYKNRKSN